MKLKEIFKHFYGVDLEIGPKNSLKTSGMELLPEDIRTRLEKWLNENRDHIIQRLKNEKR